MILYPGKKLEYSEPVIDTLLELKKQLRSIKYAFVIGYSFKDPHLARLLFIYAAKKNRKLVLFLVSPSAYQIYSDQLEYYKDERFPKGFTKKGFSSKGISAPLPSKLQGRVICLQYKFGKVLPKLRTKYLHDLIEAERLDSEFMFAETQPDMSRCKERLTHYINCEHMDKVEKIIDKEIVWNKLVSDDWKYSFELSIKGILNRLLISSDKTLENRWRDYLASVSSILSIDKFIFVLELRSGSATLPHRILLEFDSPSGKVCAHTLGEYLRDTILPIIKSKLQITDDNTLCKNNWIE